MHVWVNTGETYNRFIIFFLQVSKFFSWKLKEFHLNLLAVPLPPFGSLVYLKQNKNHQNEEYLFTFVLFCSIVVCKSLISMLNLFSFLNQTSLMPRIQFISFLFLSLRRSLTSYICHMRFMWYLRKKKLEINISNMFQFCQGR